MNPLLLSFLLILAVNMLFFIFAALLKTDVVTDLSYSLSFLIAAVVLMLRYPSDGGLHALLATAMVGIWALRLGLYLFGRILKIRVDHRFDDKRDSFVRFGAFWILQTVTVWIVILPLTLYHSYGFVRDITISSAAGIVIWAAGLIFEAVSDRQKQLYKNKGGKGLLMEGLWKYSRHPNYFGEILLWWGFYLFLAGSLPLGPKLGALGGPLFISILLLFVSGIPLVEQGWQERYGSDPEFRRYMVQTSVIIPLPTRRNLS